MAQRRALFIGNTRFDDLDAFPTLSAPANDVKDFASTLQTYGEFDVVKLFIDEKNETLKSAIEDFYNETERGDLALLYYSGHGYVDKNRNYYLIAQDTISNRPLATGISEQFIHSAMLNCRSLHRVVILDCCFSGVFAREGKSSSESVLFEKLQGEATAILTSSSAVQKSYEEKDVNSLFTQYLMMGVTSGQADEDNDGFIAVDEFFRYAERKVKEIRPEQTPMMLLRTRESRVLIATNPKVSVSKRLAEIEIANLPHVGIITGDQRLGFIEVCFKLREQLVAFRAFIEDVAVQDEKIKTSAEWSNYFLMAQHQMNISRSRNIDSRYSNYRYDTYRRYDPYRYPTYDSRINRYGSSSAGDALFLGVAVIANLFFAGKASSELWKIMQEQAQRITPLIEPVERMALRVGFDKSELWTDVENNFDLLRSSIASLSKDKGNLASLGNAIAQSEAHLTKLIGSLEGWKIFDSEVRSAKWFNRQIKHLFETNRIQPIVRKTIPSLLITPLTNLLTDNYIEHAVKPSLLSWRVGKIQSLSDAFKNSAKLASEWQAGDEGIQLLVLNINNWHESLELEIRNVIHPLYIEFNIPNDVPVLPTSSFNLHDTKFLRTLKANDKTGLQKVDFVVNISGGVAKAMLVALGIISVSSFPMLLFEIPIAAVLAVVGLGYAAIITGLNLKSEKVSTWVKKKFINANLPQKLRDRISDDDIKKMVEEIRIQVRSSINEALYESISADDLIQAIREEVETQAGIAATYIK